MIGVHPLVKVYLMGKEVSNSILITGNVCECIGEILDDGGTFIYILHTYPIHRTVFKME